jgi:hypothetical protein
MIDTLKNDMKQAMRDKNKEKLSTLRMLLATIETERSKAGLGSVEDFTEEQIIGFINRNIKALKQEIESLKNADRDFSKQEREIEVLTGYLPQQLDEIGIRLAVETAIRAINKTEGTFGSLMGMLSILKGKADMGLVSKIAKEEWNKQ